MIMEPKTFIKFLVNIANEVKNCKRNLTLTYTTTALETTTLRLVDGFRKGKLVEIDWGNMKEQQLIDYILALGIKNGTMAIPSIKFFDKLAD